MTISLRPYQLQAVAALFTHFGKSKLNPLVVLPTGSGKSLVIAAFVKEALSRYPETKILILTHRKELIEQDSKALNAIGVHHGIYSAGLGLKQIRPVTVGGVQSVVGDDVGMFNLAIVDECHLVPHDDEGSYRTIFASLKTMAPLKVIGFTATDYRLNGGRLTSGANKVFDCVAYEKPVRELVTDGYLAPLVSPPVTAVNTNNVEKRGGEFVPSSLERAVDQEKITQAAIDEWERLAKGRRASLWFCVTVSHAVAVTMALKARGINAELITGETESAERKATIVRFVRGEVHCLVSVDVLTTGFDAPVCDCLVMLRPTMSTGLYVQMAGRGMRLHPGKTDCLVLDFAGNIARHGPIDDVRVQDQGPKKGEVPQKLCPSCRLEVPLGCRECPNCFFIFEVVREVKHAEKASTKPIMGTPTAVEHRVYTDRVDRRYCSRHEKGDDKPDSMRVDYMWDGRCVVSEWVCFNHEGYARTKAEKWWRSNGGDLPFPEDVDEAIERDDELLPVETVTYEKDGKFYRVKNVSFVPVALGMAPF